MVISKCTCLANLFWEGITVVDGIIHRLKILSIFAGGILDVNKTFELRYNDRNYQKGGFIKFVVVDGEGHVSRHPLGRELFQIVYFLEGWGLKDGYAALGIQRLPQELLH